MLSCESTVNHAGQEIAAALQWTEIFKHITLYYTFGHNSISDVTAGVFHHPSKADTPPP